MFSLKQVRDCIKEECDKKTSCTGCKYSSFRLGICMIKNVSDEELEQLAGLLKDKKSESEYRKSLILEEMEIELARLWRALEDLKC